MLEGLDLIKKSMIQREAQRLLNIAGRKLEGGDIVRFEDVPHSVIAKIIQNAPGLVDTSPWNAHPGQEAIWDMAKKRGIPNEVLYYDGYLVSADRNDFRITLDAIRIHTDKKEQMEPTLAFCLDLMSHNPDERDMKLSESSGVIDAFFWWD